MAEPEINLKPTLTISKTMNQQQILLLKKMNKILSIELRNIINKSQKKRKIRREYYII